MCLSTKCHEDIRVKILKISCSHYQQVSRVAMGNKMGPNHADLFVGCVEKQIFRQYSYPVPDYLGRNIDDCLGIASPSPVEYIRTFCQFC